jgi:hypothetical protein
MTTEPIVPHPIQRYFGLASQPDSDEYFALFTADATVEDEGSAHHGIDGIRTWRTQIPLVDYVIHGAEQSGAATDVSLDIVGDFPGSPIRLSFHFELDDRGRIRTLRIRP